MAPTGSFINEQSVTIPNLLYNLIASVLTEDQSARPISNLKVEMSVATNRRGGNQVIQQIRYGHGLLIYKTTSRGHGTHDLASDKSKENHN
jgi:hypothetical protein